MSLHLYNYIVVRLVASDVKFASRRNKTPFKLFAFTRDVNEYQRSNVLMLFLSLPFAAAVRSG